ncbi:Uncharacterized conserved protein PhnB, glyoxalase superfamily [Amycolatopsis arida]|uniref:Uncharacterized conserved protein PhnB, glyoxalase superfamily n=1 Tax=Amycolatopsis arida TaxID=587909 RepID=A0A1I5U034_9PSEU|nr:VOC family protein [Amycolatopsis arida]TDX95888.1 putative glyoxalase superfamily protein PhnB [Amycolatopsis arida]SFP88521.1 Uncharacterized conserved protein PhnB, glyoxalase superfamily [Amycolatopsis arida]
MTDPLEALRRPHHPIEPDPEFAATLRERLRREILTKGGADMTTTEAPARAEYHSLVPYLAVPDAHRAIEFYEEVFGATRRGDPVVMPDGRIGHAELAIGDAVLMLAEEFPEIEHVAATAGGASIRVEVSDVDTAVERAAARGGRVVVSPRDEGHGRQANITDPFGQRWLVAQAPRHSSAGHPTPQHGEAAYFTFTVPDDETAKAFYGAVLGWRFSPGTVPRAWSAAGTGLPDAGVWGGQDYRGWKLMYAVDDLDAAVERVREHGGRVREVKREPYGRTADCVDDQGVEFWLWQT